MPKTFQKLELSSSKTLIFRLLVLASLLVTCILFGTFTYLLLERAEYRNYRDQYESIANQIDSYAKISIINAKTAGEQLAITTGLIDNTASIWPNASIAGFTDISEKLRIQLQIKYTYLLPIVYPESLAGFEAHAERAYAADPTYPPDTGYIPDVGFGVFKFAPSPRGVKRVPDRTGETNFSPNKILVPTLTGFPLGNSDVVLMLNVHSYAPIASVIDSIISCVNATELSQRNSSSCLTMTTAARYETAEDSQPFSFLYFPVFPHNSPDTLVGFVTMGYLWKTILLNSLPDYVTGIDCVLCSPTPSSVYSSPCITFTIINGRPELVAEDDVHNSDYDDMMRSVKISLGGSTASSSVDFELFIYPSDQFYNIYRSDTPLLCTIGAVALILLTSFIFLGYDFFVKADVRATSAVLKSKRKFVRYISHEIRTPMNTVSLGLRVVDEHLNKMQRDRVKQDGEEAIEVVELRSLTEEIREGAETAVMVLNDFLQFDKVENSTLTVDLSESDPIQFLRKSASVFELQSKESDVRLNFYSFGFSKLEGDEEEEKNELIVLVDKIRLAKVIRNLVTNALKFSPPGEEVFLTCTRKEDGLPNYRLSETNQQKFISVGSFLFAVEDAGPGISRETQRKLFDEGIQFDVNELQRGQLSGLGLWISKAIVELHGGRIWAESEGVKRGTKFFVELPLLKRVETSFRDSTTLKDRRKLYHVSNKVAPDLSESTSSLVVPSVGIPSTARSRAKRVLIVDDAPSNRKMLSRLLTMRGYECDAVEDGLDCVRVMQEQAEMGSCLYDFILLDYQMIHMNGPETAQKVRKMGFSSDKVKIIGVTGNVMREDMEVFLRKGADRVMQKPFCLETFEKDWG